MRRKQLSRIRAVVFDFDDTLAATNIDFGLMRRRVVEHMRRWGLWEEGIEEGRYVLEMVDWAARKLGDDARQRDRYEAEARRILEEVELQSCPDAEPFPGTLEALESLRGCGLGVGIITRNCRAGVQAVTDRFELHYDVLLTRDDVARVKPDRAHLDRALAELSTAPCDALMVGNHVTDIEVGRAAGTLTCGVGQTEASRRELEAAGADLCVSNVAALAQMVCEANVEQQCYE